MSCASTKFCTGFDPGGMGALTPLKYAYHASIMIILFCNISHKDHAVVDVNTKGTNGRLTLHNSDYTRILPLVLFHVETMCSRSLSESWSGE